MAETLEFGYKELKGSGEITLDSSSGTASGSRKFYGPWNKRFDFAKTILGQSINVFGTLIYISPSSFPDYKAAKANSVRISGFGETNVNETTGAITYEFAQVDVNYASVAFPLTDGPNDEPDTENPLASVEESAEIVTEVVNIPGKDLINEITGEVFVNNIPGFNLKLVTIIYNLRQPNVKNPNWTAINNSLNKVNQFQFITPSGQVATKGTLLYLGPSVSSKIDVVATINDELEVRINFELIHRFEHKLEGWNFVFDPDSTADDKWVPVLGENNKPLYRQADHNEIFR